MDKMHSEHVASLIAAEVAEEVPARPNWPMTLSSRLCRPELVSLATPMDNRTIVALSDSGSDSSRRVAAYPRRRSLFGKALKASPGTFITYDVDSDKLSDLKRNYNGLSDVHAYVRQGEIRHFVCVVIPEPSMSQGSWEGGIAILMLGYKSAPVLDARYEADLQDLLDKLGDFLPGSLPSLLEDFGLFSPLLPLYRQPQCACCGREGAGLQGQQQQDACRCGAKPLGGREDPGGCGSAPVVRPGVQNAPQALEDGGTQEAGQGRHAGGARPESDRRAVRKDGKGCGLPSPSAGAVSQDLSGRTPGTLEGALASQDADPKEILKLAELAHRYALTPWKTRFKDPEIEKVYKLEYAMAHSKIDYGILLFHALAIWVTLFWPPFNIAAIPSSVIWITVFLAIATFISMNPKWYLKHRDFVSSATVVITRGYMAWASILSVQNPDLLPTIGKHFVLSVPLTAALDASFLVRGPLFRATLLSIDMFNILSVFPKDMPLSLGGVEMAPGQGIWIGMMMLCAAEVLPPLLLHSLGTKDRVNYAKAKFAEALSPAR
eukprot:jgi/Botrbrau1/725/Bobra.160_2s0048.1